MEVRRPDPGPGSASDHLLHWHGGTPQAEREQVLLDRSSPRAWRYALGAEVRRLRRPVFSTQVEVAPSIPSSEGTAQNLLHAHGGAPALSECKYTFEAPSPRTWRCAGPAIQAPWAANQSSPRTWRYACPRRARQTLAGVFSTRVEVSRHAGPGYPEWLGLLHVRGGAPRTQEILVGRLGSSPRMWRCSGLPEQVSRLVEIFSASAEVRPLHQWRPKIPQLSSPSWRLSIWMNSDKGVTGIFSRSGGAPVQAIVFSLRQQSSPQGGTPYTRARTA